MTGVSRSAALAAFCVLLAASCGGDPSVVDEGAAPTVEDENEPLGPYYEADPAPPNAFHSDNPMDGRACLQCPDMPWKDRVPTPDAPRPGR